LSLVVVAPFSAPVRCSTAESDSDILLSRISSNSEASSTEDSEGHSTRCVNARSNQSTINSGYTTYRFDHIKYDDLSSTDSDTDRKSVNSYRRCRRRYAHDTSCTDSASSKGTDSDENSDRHKIRPWRFERPGTYNITAFRQSQPSAGSSNNSGRKRRAIDTDTTTQSTDDGSCLSTGYETDLDEYVTGSSSVEKARYDTYDSSDNSDNDYNNRSYYKSLKRKYDADDTDSDDDTDAQAEKNGMLAYHKKRRFQ